MSDWPSTYVCAPKLGVVRGSHALRPISWEDRVAIRQWRNDQLDVLRQRTPLSEHDQDDYFESTVRPSFGQIRPAQVLVAYTENEQLVGYGGVVHIDWDDRRGEISFLTSRERADSPDFEQDWSVFIGLLAAVARDDLHLHKLTTETYAFRDDVVRYMRRAGMQPEGRLVDHHRVGEEYVDSLLHGLVLD